MSIYASKSTSTFHSIVLAFQKKLLTQALEKNKGNIFKTAKELGLSRGTFYKILKTQ